MGVTNLDTLEVQVLKVDGTTLAGGLALGTSELVDLNGEADALVLDANGDTTISAPTNDQIDVELNGADDFRFTPNTFTALAGSTIATDTIAETTSAAGVTIDGALVKDSTVTATLIGAQQDPVRAASGDGAITVAPGTVVITKGSIAALTLAAPTATTHDGYVLRIVSTTAFAHVITSSVRGFNAKGSSGTATFGGARGDALTLVAYNGDWWTVGAPRNVTLA